MPKVDTAIPMYHGLKIENSAMEVKNDVYWLKSTLFEISSNGTG